MEKTDRLRGHKLRKSLKKKAKYTAKKHYWIFFTACLFAAILGTQFGNSLDFIKSTPSIFGSDHSIESENSTGMLVSKEQQAQILLNLFNEDKEDADADVSHNQEESIQKNESNTMGRTRGVFASVVNSVSSGSFIVTIVVAISNITGSTHVATVIFIILSMAGFFAVWFFVNNVYKVIMNRLFLEGRTYDKVRPQRFLFLLRVKGWAKASLTMFVTSILYWLWTLTIVGGIIKRYSYYLVPYIVAENPMIKPMQAITLSRKMMKGHKWECFLLELSFLGWSILGIVTLGLSSLFYSNMYETATYTEYYASLRSDFLERDPESKIFLNDIYLFRKPSSDLLAATYSDMVNEFNSKVLVEPEMKGISGFFAKVFGVVLWNNKKEQEYDEYATNALKLKNYQAAVEGQIYPGRLHPMPEKEKRNKVEVVHFLRHYSVCSLIMMFFIMSFIGWIWEVGLHLVTCGEFVNRGVQFGPWLPIYGSGGLLILIVLNKLRKHPIAEFFSAIVLCGIVEYMTSYVLEVTHGGVRWWNYDGYFLNLNGRICAEGLLVFGLGGIAIVYLIAPMIDNMLRKIPMKIIVPICLILLILFGIDKAYSSKHPNMGKGITSVAQGEDIMMTHSLFDKRLSLNEKEVICKL